MRQKSNINVYHIMKVGSEILKMGGGYDYDCVLFICIVLDTKI